MALSLTDVCQLGIGVLSIFGGFPKKIAPPERAVIVWTGAASLLATLAILAVKIFGLMSSSSSSKILWSILALCSLAASAVSCFLYVSSRQTLTADYAGTSRIVGTEYTDEAKKHLESNANLSNEDLLYHFGGKAAKAWTDRSLKRSRRILAIEYALFIACLAFGLNLALEVLNRDWKPAEVQREPTFKEMASGLRDVHFDLNRSDIGEDASEKLNEDVATLGKIFNRFPGAHVTVEGYCDDQGSSDYNLKLGFQRADEVKKRLISAGMPADKLEVSSLGKESFLCGNADEQCRQKNRRVHLAVTE
jgi:outer membrane protein OmpA-like peptidoglycan-associated protein